MRDKLKSLVSVDESEYDSSTHNGQEVENGIKTVTFADAPDSSRVHLTGDMARLSAENAA